MFNYKNKGYPKAFKNLFTLKPKNEYQLKRSYTLLEPFFKSKFSQLCINYRGPHLWNTIILSQNADLEQSTTLNFFKENVQTFFSLLKLLHFYFDIVLYKTIKIFRKRLIH